MKDLTEIQLDFLYRMFHHDKYPDWKRIADKLIKTGKCIVGGDKCIWQGGIGNFITTEPAEDTVGCLLYTFDLKGFAKSETFKLNIEHQINCSKEGIIREKKRNKELKELRDLLS